MLTTLVPIATPASNAFLLLGERVVVVDTLLPGNAKRILAAIKKAGRKPADISLILLTHGHIDHIGSAKELHSITNAPIGMHWADLEMIQTGYEPVLNPVGRTGHLLSRVLRPKAINLMIDIMLEGCFYLDRYGVNAQVIESAGPTAGSISVISDAGQAIVGDLLRGDFFRQGRPNYHWFADDINTVDSSLQMLANLPLEDLHVGHGKSFKFNDVRHKFTDLFV